MAIGIKVEQLELFLLNLLLRKYKNAVTKQLTLLLNIYILLIANLDCWFQPSS